MEERRKDCTKSLHGFRISWQQHLEVLEILPGTRAAWAFTGLRRGKRGCSEQVVMGGLGAELWHISNQMCALCGLQSLSLELQVIR